MRLLKSPAFLAVNLGHLGVDLLNGQTGVLLAALSLSLGLRNVELGLIATAYALTGALAQPVFGWLADRKGGGWLAAGGVLWMAVFFALYAVAPARWALACLVAAALGSGAFHPPGTARAAQAGGQAATAASIFFLFGQIGLSAGPALGGLILEHGGRAGVLAVALAVAPIGLFSAWALRGPAAHAARSSAAPARPAPAPQVGLFVIILLISGLRIWAQTVVTTFAPKFYLELQWPASDSGAIVAVYMAGTALGGLAGSALADRWSYTRTVLITQTLSILPFLLFPLAHGPAAYALAAAAGLFNGGPHSILVTMAQRTLPGRAGFASGLILGLTFALAALGTSLTGWLADQFGLLAVLQVNAAIALAAALLSLLLFGPRRAAQPAAAD
ncbi:MAG: MFS transporter [Anaerolineales bacterium]|nr:MFS transporter [Anaerolineales bacterium]